MKRYLVAAIAALAITLGIGGASSTEAASSACPAITLQGSYTVSVGGSVGTAQAIPTLDPNAPRIALAVPFYVFDVADSGHQETVLFGSSRDAQLRSIFPASAFVKSCSVGYYAYSIDLTGAGHFETVIVGSFREAQLRATGYIN